MKFQTSVIRAALLLSAIAGIVSAQASPDPTPTPPPSPSMFLSIGGGYNHYTAPVTAEGMLNLGIQMGTSSFYSISTLAMQSKSASVRSGFGWGVKRSGPVLLILLADGGITTGSSGLPGASAFALGNVGGGVLARYDLGALSTKFKNVGLSGGVRIASVAGTSVQPEYMASVSYYLK